MEKRWIRKCFGGESVGVTDALAMESEGVVIPMDQTWAKSGFQICDFYIISMFRGKGTDLWDKPEGLRRGLVEDK